MADKEATLDSIQKRLDILINLQLLGMDMSRLSTATQRIEILADMGLAPAEIGRCIGKEANYVSAMMSQRKGGKSAKGKAK